ARHDWTSTTASRPANGWLPAIADEPVEPTALDRYSTTRFAGVGSYLDLQRSRARWVDELARRSVRERGVAETVKNAAPAGYRPAVRSTRARMYRVRHGWTAEISQYTRKLVHDEGLVWTGGRAVRYGGKLSLGIGQRLLGLPGPRHVVAAIRRLRRSVQIH